MITNPLIVHTEAYFFDVALIVAAVLNFVLAAMLLFDSNNYLYAETPRYLRSRRLTGVSLIVFGVGFLLHWLFAPHFTNLLAGKALSFSYFHIGGVLLSMSHTGLIDRHYFTRRVVVRDAAVLLVSLTVYWINAWIADTTLTYLGSALFFLHIGYLTWVFYSRFNKIYRQLGKYADYKPNDTDHEVLWLHYSCHLIIAFGIGGMLCTVLFHDAILPFAILLVMGVAVFSYIYKALDSFGVIASEIEGDLQESEEYMINENTPSPILPAEEVVIADDDSSTASPDYEIVTDEVIAIIEQWVAARHYADPKLTIKDTLRQMDITEQELNQYLESCTDQSGYRQWLSHLRIEEAKRLLLQHPDYTIQTIANECGYSSSSTLTRAFKTHEGAPPMEWYSKNK